MHNINKKNIKNIKYIPAAKRQAAKTLGKEATQIKYSVIIPVFNSEKYIEKCVCSLLQSAPIESTEIILVNDGSKDKSAEICKRLAAEHDCIKYINKEHGGAASARNAGLKQATGEFILFCDSDDYVRPDYFTKAELFGNEDLIVFGYTSVYKSCSLRHDIPQSILNGSDNFEKLNGLYKSKLLYELYTKRFKRSIITQNEICFHEELPICEDMNFCLQYALCCKSIAIKNDALYFYNRTNKNSLIHSRKTGLTEIFPKAFAIAAKTIKSSSLTDNQKEKLLQTTDYLYTATFITCAGEELKDENAAAHQIIRQIGKICREFQTIHFAKKQPQGLLCKGIRACIKLRLGTITYLLVKAHRHRAEKRTSK